MTRAINDPGNEDPGSLLVQQKLKISKVNTRLCLL